MKKKLTEDYRRALAGNIPGSEEICPLDLDKAQGEFIRAQAEQITIKEVVKASLVVAGNLLSLTPIQTQVAILP